MKITFSTVIFVVSPSEMVVTWVTKQSTNTSLVEYGIKDLSRTAKGFEEVFIDGGDEKRLMYIHRVTITGLQAGQKYSEYLSLFTDNDYPILRCYYIIKCQN